MRFYFTTHRNMAATARQRLWNETLLLTHGRPQVGGAFEVVI